MYLFFMIKACMRTGPWNTLGISLLGLVQEFLLGQKLGFLTLRMHWVKNFLTLSILDQAKFTLVIPLIFRIALSLFR